MVVQTQDFHIYNINEVIIQTQRYVYIFLSLNKQAVLGGQQGPRNAVWQGPPNTNQVKQCEIVLSFKVSRFIQLWKQSESVYLVCLGIKRKSVDRELSLLIKISYPKRHKTGVLHFHKKKLKRKDHLSLYLEIQICLNIWFGTFPLNQQSMNQYRNTQTHKTHFSICIRDSFTACTQHIVRASRSESRQSASELFINEEDGEIYSSQPFLTTGLVWVMESDPRESILLPHSFNMMTDMAWCCSDILWNASNISIATVAYLKKLYVRIHEWTVERRGKRDSSPPLSVAYTSLGMICFGSLMLLDCGFLCEGFGSDFPQRSNWFDFVNVLGCFISEPLYVI